MAVANEIVLERIGSHHVVRDKRSGHSYKLKGYGALEGQIAFRSDIDLTKPIAEQAAKIESRRTRATRKASKAA